MLAPEAIAEFLSEYQAEQKRLNAGADRELREGERQLAKLDKQIRNIVDAIADGAATISLKAKLRELEAEKARLIASLDFLRASTKVVELRPASIDSYRTKIEELQLGLQSNDSMRMACEIRSLVTSIEVHPCEERGQVELFVKGAIADLLDLPKKKPHAVLSTVMVVAGEGLEPPTRGL